MRIDVTKYYIHPTARPVIPKGTKRITADVIDFNRNGVIICVNGLMLLLDLDRQMIYNPVKVTP